MKSKLAIVTTQRSTTFYLAFTILLMLCAYFFGLFVDTTGDAGKYAAIARNIIESGDIINLKIHGEPYDQKPPLLFWLAAIGFKIGGLHNWSFKLFPILYSFSGFWFTYKLGETLYNKKTGKLAALMLSSSWVFFLFTMDVHTDLILQANVTLAIWQLVAFINTRKTSHFIWAFIGVGLAMLSKGPIGAAVPAFALGTHLLLKRQYKEIIHPRWLLGIAIALIVSSPALIGLYNQFGVKGLKFFFIVNNVGRITGSYAGDNNDYLFYLHTMLYLVLPWTLLLIYGFYKEFGSYFRTSYKHREYYTLGGIWVFILIASVARGKAPHYVFMLIPMIFAVTANWLTKTFENANPKTIKRLLFAQTFIPFLITAFLLLIMGFLFPPNKVVIWALPIISITVALLVIRSKQELQIKLFAPSVIMMATLIIYLNSQALPEAYKYQASTQAAQLYNQQAGPDEPLYNYLYLQYELYFYSNTDAKRIYSIKEFSPDPKNDSWIFTNEAGKDTIMTDYGSQISATFPLKHRGMTDMRPKFLNPTTREQTLTPMYLIKIKASERK